VAGIAAPSTAVVVYVYGKYCIVHGCLFDMGDHVKEVDWNDLWGDHGGSVRITAAVMENALMEHYGERCPEYQPGCLCCEKWRAFDRLFYEIPNEEVQEALRDHCP
jgi:hypothetical protein